MTHFFINFLNEPFVSNQTCVNDNKNCKHFENMLAATTHRVGCALSRCENDFLQNSDYIVVCQYWPKRIEELFPLYEKLDTSSGTIDENSCSCMEGDKCVVVEETDDQTGEDFSVGQCKCLL